MHYLKYTQENFNDKEKCLNAVVLPVQSVIPAAGFFPLHCFCSEAAADPLSPRQDEIGGHVLVLGVCTLFTALQLPLISRSRLSERLSLDSFFV